MKVGTSPESVVSARDWFTCRKTTPCFYVRETQLVGKECGCSSSSGWFILGLAAALRASPTTEMLSRELIVTAVRVEK